MEQLATKTLQTSRGFTYRYYASETATGPAESIAVLLLHGFRDFATCWKFTLPKLSQLPYRLIIPDLLGHGGTSKPRDTTAYAYHLMVQDLIEILDVERITQVVPIGHDHGAVLAARVYNHIPSRTAALVTLNVAYSPPMRAPFNLLAVNAGFQKVFGYAAFEYHLFLTAPDAAGVMNANLDRVWDIPHANSFQEMRHLYGEPNAMRDYLSNPATPRVAIKPYAQDNELKLDWKTEIAKGGLEAPLCWYTAMVQQVQFESDKSIPKEHDMVEVPYLFIGCDGDAPCRHEMIKSPLDAGMLPDATIQILKGVGHWPMYEEPETTADMIADFLVGRLGMSQNNN